MRFKDLIRNNSWPSVEIALLDLYPDQKRNISGYEIIFSQLLIMPEDESDMEIVLERVEDEDSTDGYYNDVSGKKKDTTEDEAELTSSYALEFTPWDQWLAMRIGSETLKEFSEPEIIAHCLFEMTFIGFDEATIQREWNEIEREVEEVTNMSPEEKKEKLISFEELMAELNNEAFEIRQARDGEENLLTEISFASKGYWNYPPEYLKIWEPELTITKNYLSRNKVFVYESDKEILAFYSIVNLSEPLILEGIEIGEGIWLDHMFVRPDQIGHGIGKRLFTHLTGYCKENSIGEIKILVDPNARGFYEKMGCEYIKEYLSTIKSRTIPMMIFRVNG
jgi:GNAT superfamily N-acetyltransferase